MSCFGGSPAWRLADDMEIDEATETYTHSCRCSGSYVITADQLSEVGALPPVSTRMACTTRALFSPCNAALYHPPDSSCSFHLSLHSRLPFPACRDTTQFAAAVARCTFECCMSALSRIDAAHKDRTFCHHFLTSALPDDLDPLHPPLTPHYRALPPHTNYHPHSHLLPSSRTK